MRKLFCFVSILLIWNFYANAQQQTRGKLLTIEEINAFRDSVNKSFQLNFSKAKLWGDSLTDAVEFKKGELIFRENFKNLTSWAHEGIGYLNQPEKNVMQLNCIGSEQGNRGCMAFCRRDFPDSIIIEYEKRVLSTNGLVITFIASKGRKGEDMLTDLPERKGVFADYVYNPFLRSYHLSLSRYNDQGIHTGVSNWRRNPGLFLMGQQKDLCTLPHKWYQIRIIKAGGLLELFVNNQFAGGFIDRDEIPEPIPDSGKIGFRAIGKKVIVQIRNFRVFKIQK